ncbi:hypothetical protein D3C86_1721450 [compost metagenome]
MESLRLDETGDIQFELIAGAEELAQCCRIGIGTNKGEWFLNPEAGITFGKFLGKQISEAEMLSELTQGLLQEGRIITVDAINFTINEKSRTMLVDFTAIGSEGEQIQTEGVLIGAG